MPYWEWVSAALLWPVAIAPYAVAQVRYNRKVEEVLRLRATLASEQARSGSAIIESERKAG